MQGLSLNVTTILIGINVLIFFGTQGNWSLIEQYIFNIDRVRKKEYYRLFTAGFLHSGILHLAFNMITLYFFGPYLEQSIGPFLYALLFIASIVGGNLYCMLMCKERPSYSALGASGGVLGVIFGFIALVPFASLSFFFVPIPIPAWIFGIMFSVSSIVLTQLRLGAADIVSHEGHLGGALVGALFLPILGFIDFYAIEVQYFYGIGVGSIVLFALIKIAAPSLLYRYRR